MMSLQSLTAVTLTGVDALQNVDLLAKISDATPYLEWAVLYSPTRAGSLNHGCTRYPHIDWIDRHFLGIMAERRKAIHLCGLAVDQFLAGDPSVNALASRFDRVQLNFNHTKKPVPVDSLLLAIAAFREAYGEKSFILQHNKSNAALVKLVSGTPGICALFDGSGGRGVSPTTWPDPLMSLPCGYAGGLGPDNIERELPFIAHKAGDAPFWIDMESKLRDEEDVFDIARAMAVVNGVNRLLMDNPAGKNIP